MMVWPKTLLRTARRRGPLSPIGEPSAEDSLSADFVEIDAAVGETAKAALANL
jgi:hypothetical protein